MLPLGSPVLKCWDTLARPLCKEKQQRKALLSEGALHRALEAGQVPVTGESFADLFQTSNRRCKQSLALVEGIMLGGSSAVTISGELHSL